MNCESAEGQLSAYLDSALDSQLNTAIEAHLRECPRCAATLADYRSLDGMLAAMPRVEPSPQLRERIFSSPEYAALLRDLEDGKGARAGAPQNSVPRLAARRTSAVSWPRVLLPAAAVLALALGGGLAARETIFAPNATPQATMVTIGNPGSVGVPLAAGTRLLYEHGGRLLSAPEGGPGLAQPLTSSSTQVAAWSVSPLATGSGSQLVAYIDAATGAVHITRTDGLGDMIVAYVSGGSVSARFWSSAVGAAVRSGLAWAPDGQQLAYVATAPDGTTALHIVNVDGTNDRAINASAHGLVSTLTWSADSLHLAFVDSIYGSSGIWAYDVAAGRLHLIARQADPAHLTATVRQIGWLPNLAQPTITWSSGEGADITGLFVRSLTDATERRLTSAATTLSAATYASSATTGQWLVAEGTTLTTIMPDGGALAAGGTATAPVTRITWAAGGIAAAIAGHGWIAIWTPAQGLSPVAQAADTSIAPAWSADGTRLAYASNGTVVLASVSNGGWGAQVTQVAIAGASDLAWAPDGTALGVASTHGVAIVAFAGQQARQIATQPATGGAIAWSTAG